MSFLHKVLKSESPSYLFNTIPNSNRQRQTRNSGNIPPLFVKHYFFLSAVTNWNKLDCYISNVDSFEVFKKRVFFFSMWVFFHEHSRITGLQGKGEGISLTPHSYFHPLHRHLDISRDFIAESSPLYIASSRTRTGNLWFPSASR